MSPTSQNARPLIVGAGPVGKAAALFLARAGIPTRIIESALEPSPFSKALAVNPRTLELLAPTGVTETMLRLGLQIHGARIWRGQKLLAAAAFESIQHRYPFMLSLSQAVTERLLEDALIEQGGKVERGTALVTCRNQPDGAVAELRHSRDESREVFPCPWLLAADGAHSTVRHALEVEFRGNGFDAPWHLADVALNTSLDQHCAHVFLMDRGFVFTIRMVEDVAQETRGEQLWRVISNLPDPIERLPMAAPSSPPVWQSSFRIAHRIVDRMQVGNVYFAGDAAHIHSPIGARGMNLGIEDGWTFSELVRSGRMSRYDALRRSVDYQVVNRVETFSRMVRGESIAARLVREFAMRVLTKIPVARRQLINTVTGLDHALQAE